MHTLKKWLACLAAVLMLAALVACGDSGSTPGSQATNDKAFDDSAYDMDDTTDATGLGALYSPDDTWAVYWYLCGSDLETKWGAASTDLQEMFAVDLPDNVTIVIETGGAEEWHLDIDPATNSRYTYTSAGFELVDQKASENMGDPDTLADFLAFCNENYPADHTAVLFWNHGGGSVAGAAFDELFDSDSLTLPEMREAFAEVYALDSDAPPFELVGFDTCLMATIDVALAFQDIGSYLVASEEVEPGCGWYYTGWVGALAENPGLNGGHLGKAICDSYYEACEAMGLADNITLSVTDLSRLTPLMEAYNAIGQEALASACADPAYFFSGFGRAARSAENYGGNNDNDGYTNMVDLGDLVRSAAGLLPETSDAVLSALDDCVVYQAKGPYRSQATGLACFYSYNNDYNNFNNYATLGTSEAFTHLYDYGITGMLSDAGLEYVSDVLYADEDFDEAPAPVPAPEPGSLENYPVVINDEGYAVLELGPDNTSLLTSVRFQIAYVDPDSGMILFLGGDNDLEQDWENGIFTDNFRGVWGALDDQLVYMEITYEDDDYTLYTVPVLLNGEEQNLVVGYSYDTSSYYILGVRSGVDDNGMANNLYTLEVGDVVEPILPYTTLDSDDFSEISTGSVTITENTTFAETDLGDGIFAYMFEMLDIQNNSYLSDLVFISVEDGEITMETMDMLDG